MEDDLNTSEEPEGFGGLPEENPARNPITRERIAERAYLISQSDQAGTDEENWLRAERELQQEQEGLGAFSAVGHVRDQESEPRGGRS